MVRKIRMVRRNFKGKKGEYLMKILLWRKLAKKHRTPKTL
jgi:hypothetical protein